MSAGRRPAHHAAANRDHLQSVRRYGLRGAQSRKTDGKEQLVAQQRFVTIGETRGDQIAILSGVTPKDVVVTPASTQAEERRDRQSEQQHFAAQRSSAAPGGPIGSAMSFTDIFIRRPVLAIVISLAILVIGLQSVHLDAGAPISADPERRGHRFDGLFRRQSRDDRRLHHDAAGKRHRPGERHRLHDVVEHSGHVDDHGQSSPQLRCQQGAGRKSSPRSIRSRTRCPPMRNSRSSASRSGRPSMRCTDRFTARCCRPTRSPTI